MFKYVIYVVLPLLVRIDSESCYTPSGISSECVSLYDCAPLVSAFAHIPMSGDVIQYLRLSHCGFDGDTPKVCCGPFPPTLISNNNQFFIPTKNSVDLVDHSDSYPESRKMCGIDTSGNKIFGGTETVLDEFPWMALLGYRTYAGQMLYVCGGSLINHRYVLTAAHCLIQKLQQTVGELKTVRLGEYDTRYNTDCYDEECADPPQEILVQSFHVHTGFSDTNKNRADDIGLIRLSQRAKYNDFVKPICLVSKENSKYNADEIVYVAGWGRTEIGSPSPIKLKLAIPIYEKSNCSFKYKQSFKIELTQKQLCAGGIQNEDTCAGDSGGPVMRLLPGDIWEVIGIVSFGYSCGYKGWPGVYTSVADYLDWIQNKMIQTNV